MNKILMMLAGILMMSLNVACGNMDDVEEINTEWGTEGLFPGELIPSYEGGNIHVLWEKPSVRWWSERSKQQLTPDIKWENPFKKNIPEYGDYIDGASQTKYFHMMGIELCKSKEEFISLVSKIACGPDFETDDESREEKVNNVNKRIRENYPSDIDFEKQSVFVFYFIGSDTINLISLFTNPKNNKPVFMAYVANEFAHRFTLDVFYNDGLLGYVVLDKPDADVKDIEVWTKIGRNEHDNSLWENVQNFDKEYPDWKIKEWRDRVIFPDKCFYEYLSGVKCECKDEAAHESCKIEWIGDFSISRFSVSRTQDNR